MSLLSAKQYTTVLLVQYTLLLYDIGVNAFVVLAQDQPVDMLVLYMQVHYSHSHSHIVNLLDFRVGEKY